MDAAYILGGAFSRITHSIAGELGRLTCHKPERSQVGIIILIYNKTTQRITLVLFREENYCIICKLLLRDEQRRDGEGGNIGQ